MPAVHVEGLALRAVAEDFACLTNELEALSGPTFVGMVQPGSGEVGLLDIRGARGPRDSKDLVEGLVQWHRHRQDSNLFEF